jgi:hexosaminidase
MWRRPLGCNPATQAGLIETKQNEMKLLRRFFTRNPDRPASGRLAIGPGPSTRHPNTLVLPSKLLGLGGLALSLLSAPALAATPAIIPLPKTMTNYPGVFTLCPSQPIPGAPARATQKILVDSPSLATGQYLATMLFRSTGYQFVVATNGSAGPVRQAILLTTVNALTNLGAEGYELTVAPDSVVIRAPAQAGLFYGVQSLLQLFPPQILSPRTVSGVAWVAPCVYIQDQPRFPWRGCMLDVARHFFDKQEVERVLDAMALNKLNTFHWHLSDDQGWRIPIPAYPLLTQTGAWRASMDYGLNPRASTAYNSSGQYGGYYSTNDIAEVIAYAQQRHITVVPEIEMPCHCQAALESYPAYGCGNAAGSYDPDDIVWDIDLFSLAGPGCWTFFTNVLTTVMGLFPSQYIHVGGDEVVNSTDTQWTTYSYDKTNMTALGISPSGGDTSLEAYQYWFSTNLASFIHANGRTMIGWSEIEAYNIVTNAVVMDWTGSAAVAAAEAGQYAVMSPSGSPGTPGCYLNYCETGTNGASTMPPSEPYFIVGGECEVLTVSNAYAFEPVPSGLTGASTNFILGAQCNLWGEYVPSPQNVEFKLFPRLSAMAELTWTPAASKSYSSFTNRLVTLEQRLTQMGINYNHESVIAQIGTWGPTVATKSPTYTTVNYTITTNVTQAGEIDVNFYYTSGADALDVTSVALLENGVQVDIDASYTGFAGLAEYIQSTGHNMACFVLHLPSFTPGATYTIQASIAGAGGTASSGTVYLVNWN